MYIYVCIYVYKEIYLCTYVHVCTHVYTFAFIFVVNMNEDVFPEHVYIHISIYICRERETERQREREREFFIHYFQLFMCNYLYLSAYVRRCNQQGPSRTPVPKITFEKEVPA